RWGGVSGGYAACATAPPAKTIVVKPAKIIVAVYFLSFNRQRLSFRDQILPPLAVKRRGKLNAKRRALAHQPSAPAGDALV
ncbi:hypothetical protein, partial [Burkholderia stagnalis]